MEKYRINKLLFIIKNELNENRLFLQRKIIMKINLRDKKKFRQKIHGEQFSKGYFPGEGGIFPGAYFLAPKESD